MWSKNAIAVLLSGSEGSVEMKLCELLGSTEEMALLWNPHPHNNGIQTKMLPLNEVDYNQACSNKRSC